MEQESSSDHLSSSLTDLMTSLMVIFILLLLVFISRTAGKDAAMTDVLLQKLQQDLKPQGFNPKDIQHDPRDKNAILVIVPNDLMNFETNESTLQVGGKMFLRGHIPALAGVLCDEKYRSSVDSIVVEGHTDKQKFNGLSPEDSQNRNLKLSQDRSMAVVEESLADLNGDKHNCFLEKLSATGRGEQDYQGTDKESRRVIFRIRIKARDADAAEKEIRQ